MNLSRRQQRGLSLVELMIALGLGAFMLLGIISLVASVSQTRTKLSLVSDQAESGRYALHALNEELALAGFLGTYHPGVGVADYQLVDPCVNSGNASDLGFDPSTLALPLAVSGVVSGAAMPACIGADSPVANSPMLNIHRVDVAEVDVASIAAGNMTPYLQVSNCELDALPYVLNTDPAALTLRAKGCASLASARPYLVRSYFISDCEDCADGGDGRPTLKMLEYSSGVRRVLPLVSGVEDLHIEYGLDLDIDGGPDCYVSDPGAAVAPGGCPAAEWSSTATENWRDTVAVRVHLLIRSEEPILAEPVEDTFDLGRADRVGPFDDRFKRQVVSTVVLIPNVAGPRE